MDVQQFISSTTKYSKQITEINSMIRRVTINNKLTLYSIILDNQASISVFSNKTLLNNRLLEKQ